VTRVDLELEVAALLEHRADNFHPLRALRPVVVARRVRELCFHAEAAGGAQELCRLARVVLEVPRAITELACFGVKPFGGRAGDMAVPAGLHRQPLPLQLANVVEGVDPEVAVDEHRDRVADTDVLLDWRALELGQREHVAAGYAAVE